MAILDWRIERKKPGFEKSKEKKYGAQFLAHFLVAEDYGGAKVDDFQVGVFCEGLEQEVLRLYVPFLRCDPNKKIPMDYLPIVTIRDCRQHLFHQLGSFGFGEISHADYTVIQLSA